jgi:quercetin dioxygenase-like cupin family protein/pyrroloquinoline quinone (PQQ) biosynthesis protein C
MHAQPDPQTAPAAAPCQVVDARLQPLLAFESAHSFWNNSLFAACRAGTLTKADFQFVFAQYYLYSKNFTRYLSGLMANLDDDLLRSRLSENLWEEGGGAAPEKRHAQIFRNFLRGGLSIDIAAIEFAPCTKLFVDQFLANCIQRDAMHASAFLSLGTEGIVSRMYSILVEGLRKAGIPDEHLEFFHIHIACDDDHAATLHDILCSFREKPEWERLCRKALDLSLCLRRDFFDALMGELARRRVDGHLQRIQAKQSLLTKDIDDARLSFLPALRNAAPMYANKVDAMNIDFTVDRAPFPAEVIDARVVRIPPHKNNERHKHAHETVFYILSGTGRVMVDDRWIAVEPGSCVFVPRWAVHQSQNQSDTEMVILAITDFYLTGKAFVGDYESTARMKRS